MHAERTARCRHAHYARSAHRLLNELRDGLAAPAPSRACTQARLSAASACIPAPRTVAPAALTQTTGRFRASEDGLGRYVSLAAFRPV